MIAKVKAGGMIFTEGTAEEYLVNADKELAKLQNFYSGYTNSCIKN